MPSHLVQDNIGGENPLGGLQFQLVPGHRVA